MENGSGSVVERAAEYDRQFRAQPVTADRTILLAARDLLEEQLQSGPISAELAHAGQRVYWHLGEKAPLVELLERYLTQPLPVEEAAWARWLVVDNLAMLHRHAAAVAAQREFLAWARGALPPERLCWVMQDGTQALAWVAAGRAEEWLAIVRDLFAHCPATPENCESRFVCLRTAGLVEARLQRTAAALALADEMRALAAEDPAWERAFDAEMEADILALNAYQEARQLTALRRAAQATATRLDARIATRGSLEGLSPAERRWVGIVAHNAAAPLYRAGQYDLAIPLFRQALDYGTRSVWTYAWLAASLWATTKDRTAVLPLLREAAARFQGTGDRAWQEIGHLPEFHEVVDDAAFRAALTVTA